MFSHDMPGLTLQTKWWPLLPRCALSKPLSRKFLQAYTAHVAMLPPQSHLIKLKVLRY